MRHRPRPPSRRNALALAPAAAAAAALTLATISLASQPAQSHQQAVCFPLQLVRHPKSPLTPPPRSAASASSSPPPTPAPKQSIKDAATNFFYDGEFYLTDKRDSVTALRYFRLAALFGHKAAHASAASILLLGTASVPRDIPAAIRHLRYAAAGGHPDAQSVFAMLYHTGLADRHGVPRSVAHSVLLDTIAAEAGSIGASTALGFRYLHGISVPRNCRRAGKHYQRAAQSIGTNTRFWPTPLSFVESKPPLPASLTETQPQRLDEHALARNNGARDTDDADIVQYFQHSAERGDVQHRTTLGALHLYGGHGIEPNEVDARAHLHRAALAGDGEAYGILGHMEMRARRNTSAELNFRQSAARNKAIGHYALGMVYRHALLGKKQDYSAAAMHFELALEDNKNHAGALYELAMLRWYGHGRDRSRTEAFALFERAAAAGQLQARLHVGTMLFDGNAPGHPAAKGDCERAVRLLKAVAEAGDWRTTLEIAGDELAAGDWYAALHRYLLAAHAGIELGQYNAAFLLERAGADRLPELSHWRRDRRLALAHAMYELSARQGHTDALIRSGNVMYLETGDLRAAARTFRLAAKLKNAEGMVALGIMHARGLGVPRSRDRAVRMFESARAADSEAVAPALVALVGFHVAWFAEDVAKAVRRRVDALLDADAGGSGVVFGVEDLVILAGLAVALVLVLVLRSKRLARQTDVQVELGR